MKTGSVAVNDPIPLVRAGLRNALADEIRVVEPLDIECWAASDDAAAAVLSVVEPGDWAVVRSVTRLSPNLPIVVLLAWSSPLSVRQAFAHGVSASMARCAPIADIARALRAALDGMAVVAREAVTPFGEWQPGWTDEERTILSELACGTRIVDLAERLGYSRRTMARRLNYIYERLGADRAPQALAAAARLGLIA